MRVFLTGHRGYIGAHLVGLLKEAGHYVVGCDLDLFAGCASEPVHGSSARDFDGDQFVPLRTLRHRLYRVTGEPPRKTG